MSELIFAIGLATGFILGAFIGWMNSDSIEEYKKEKRAVLTGRKE